MTLLKTTPTPFPEIPSLLSSFFSDGFLTGLDSPQKWLTKIPSANIRETASEFVIDLAAPGMDKKDFKIDIDHGSLRISTEKEEEVVNKDEHYNRKEFSYYSFVRSFTLPETVKVDGVKATYQDGLLKIILPKKEEAKPLPKKEIKIS